MDVYGHEKSCSVHHSGARTEGRMRDFHIPKHHGFSDGIVADTLAEPATAPSLWLSSVSFLRSQKAPLQLWLPTVLLDFQEYVCFLIKGTNTTCSSPSPASFCFEPCCDAWSYGSLLAAAWEKGQDDCRVAGSCIIHLLTGSTCFQIACFGRKYQPLLINFPAVRSPKHS